MENSSVASASSEAGSSRSQKIEELERFIDSYVLEYQVQGLLMDKMEGDGESEKTQSHISQASVLLGIKHQEILLYGCCRGRWQAIMVLDRDHITRSRVGPRLL